MAKTILLADDSVTIQKVIELTFMDQNYEVVSVSSGEEALSKLDEVTPGLVIADVHMPGATGYEVSRQVKQRMPAVPVLLLVGTFEPFDEGEFRNCGADRYLKKPFDSQELLRIVSELESVAPTASVATEAAPAMAAPPDDDPFADFDLPAAPADSGGFRLGMDDDEDSAPEPAREGDTEAVQAVTEDDDAFQLDEPAFEVEAEPAFEMADEAPMEFDDEPAFEVEAEVVEPAAEEPFEEAEDEPVAAAEVQDAALGSMVAGDNGGGGLSDEDIDRIAARVAELVGERLVREVAWEVIPDLAEVIIKDRLRELESQVE